jgi:hypothetical protein
MESKCPCCGGNRDSGFAAESFSCIDCMFMCESKDLPRIAAAMELARATCYRNMKQAQILSGDYEYLEDAQGELERADSEVFDLGQHVLEVFGGE